MQPLPSSSRGERSGFEYDHLQQHSASPRDERPTFQYDHLHQHASTSPREERPAFQYGQMQAQPSSSRDPRAAFGYEHQQPVTYQGMPGNWPPVVPSPEDRGQGSSQQPPMMDNPMMPAHALYDQPMLYGQPVSHPSVLQHPPSAPLPLTMTHYYSDTRDTPTVSEGSQSSTTLDEQRKKTRTERNRLKMKAYHKRVMQQRKVLTNILADLRVAVGSMSARPGDSRVEWPVETSAPSTSHRNKQKQESKARLRRQEIDQVYRLGLYAEYALTQDTEASRTMIHILFCHRASWEALVSVEQRLFSEVIRLRKPTEDQEGQKVIKRLVNMLEEQEAGQGMSRGEQRSFLNGGP